MQLSRRSAISIGIVVLLGIFVFLGRWYETRQATPTLASDGIMIDVTDGADRGPGTLREALFIAASASSEVTITIRARKIVITTALPPLVNMRGIRLAVAEAGTEIDASGLTSGPVLDVAGANVSIEGLIIRNCAAAAILLRSEQFRLQSATIETCDVGVDVAETASQVLIEGNRFAKNRIGVRFAGTNRNTSVVGNEFTEHGDAGIWAVRSEPDSRGEAITIRDNRFSNERVGIVAGNVAVLAETNELLEMEEAAIQLIGANAVVRGNRVRGGKVMGIVAENAQAAVIDSNELDGLAAYGIMVKGSADTLVRGNRIHNSGYGMAFVLARTPSTAVDNTIIEPKFNGIDVVGDSPVLRNNSVLRPRALALKVIDYEPADGERVRSEPFLEGNNFNRDGQVIAASRGTETAPPP